MANSKWIESERLHQQGIQASEAGRDEEAEAFYRRALALVPERHDTWFNLGLVYKFRRRWPEALAANERALALKPDDEPTCWNLGIAATALGEWRKARAGWRGFGIAVAEGDEPLEMDLGPVPVRLGPAGGGEVVWARRLDPARARIESVPLPESGFACGDVVLHDGAPHGYRRLGDREVPVFDVLDLLAPSSTGTWIVTVVALTPGDVQALEAAFDVHGLSCEDWTANVRVLCAACSEGRPHEHADSAPDDDAWRPERRLGVAAADESDLLVVLRAWSGAEAGRDFEPPELALARTTH